MRKEFVLFVVCSLFSFLFLNGQTVHRPIIIDTTRTELTINDSLYSADVTSLIDDPEIPVSSHFFTPQPIYLVGDDPIVTQLNNLNQQRYFEVMTFSTDTSLLNVYNYLPDEVPVFSDSVLKVRINQLNLQTPMELVFNSHVKGYIDLYAVRKRALTSKVLGLSEIYFPIFEEMLDKYDVPLEMKYLAIVESALNPVARSRAGASGLWQFMIGTGKMYGLQSNSVIDERFDVYKATDAACRHLKDLYNMYNSWELALAAYNCGAGNVNKAIRRSGGKTNYWQIWPYLPAETRGYVPAFIAVNYVMNYATEHNIYPVDPGIFAHEIDTVSVHDVLSFDQISEMLGVQRDLVAFLNPVYKTDIIPASPQKCCFIRLPQKYVGLFVKNEDSLYAFRTQQGLEKETLAKEIEKIQTQRTVYHKVKKGETLGGIAGKYRCTVTQLKSWNNLRSTNLKIGQNLVVQTSETQRNKSLTAITESSTANTSKHTVKQGETLSSIANKYRCSVTDLQQWNNLTGTNIAVGKVLQVNSSAVAHSFTGTVENYTVKEGDTLWMISQKYPGVSAEDIKSFNGLSSNSLKVGQTLKIPKKS